MRTSTGVWILVIVVVLLGAAFYVFGMGAPASTATPSGRTTTTNNQTGTDYTPGSTNSDAPGSLDGRVGASGTVSTLPMSATVTYDGSSYSPSSVTIAKGGTVTFTSTAGNMWVASAIHPSHAAYDGTDRATHCAAGYSGPAPFDQCASGTSFTFTFTKTGSFPYHDHMNAGAFGKVIVE